MKKIGGFSKCNKQRSRVTSHPQRSSCGLEPEICQRTDIDQRLLEETRLHAQDQQQPNEEEARSRAEVEEQRFDELAHERADHLLDEAQEHNGYAVEENERISSDAQVQAIQEEQMASILDDMHR
jgi:hypothetical protein